MHRAAITEVRLLNWLKAGRGQGFGEDYQAWIQVTRQDHASTGMSSLLVTPCFERQLHTLSSIESNIATKNLAVPCVTDLREQFPLWPFAHPSPVIELDEHHGQALSEPAESIGTVALAKQLRITHANFRGLRIKYIYTTDQLLTIVLANGLRKLLAISIKCRADLRKKKGRRRLFQKLRLERAYWRSLGVHWLLITDTMVNQTVCANLTWALAGANQIGHSDDPRQFDRFLVAMRAVTWQGRLKDLLAIVAHGVGIDQNTATRFFKIALWRSLLPVDLTQKVELLRPLPRLSAPSTGWPSWCLFKRLEGKL